MGAGNRICESWWGHRLLEGLADGDHARLSRGRSYMRRGAVTDVTVTPDRAMVAARVEGSRRGAYRVSVVYQTVEDYRWDRILADLAEDSDAVAALLAGELPEDLEEVFAEHGVRLFPDSVDDLDIHCTCPDWGYPCKHGAAVLFAFASLLDQDALPYLAWLGRTEEEILDAVGASGAGSGPAGELEVEVTPLAERVGDFWAGPAPEPLALPRPFDPLAHWEGATPGVVSRLAPMYDILGAAPERVGRR